MNNNNLHQRSKFSYQKMAKSIDDIAIPNTLYSVLSLETNDTENLKKDQNNEKEAPK